MMIENNINLKEEIEEETEEEVKLQNPMEWLTVSPEALAPVARNERKNMKETLYIEEEYRYKFFVTVSGITDEGGHMFFNDVHEIETGINFAEYYKEHSHIKAAYIAPSKEVAYDWMRRDREEHLYCNRYGYRTKHRIHQEMVLAHLGKKICIEYNFKRKVGYIECFNETGPIEYRMWFGADIPLEIPFGATIEETSILLAICNAGYASIDETTYI